MTVAYQRRKSQRTCQRLRAVFFSLTDRWGIACQRWRRKLLLVETISEDDPYKPCRRQNDRKQRRLATVGQGSWFFLHLTAESTWAVLLLDGNPPAVARDSYRSIRKYIYSCQSWVLNSPICLKFRSPIVGSMHILGIQKHLSNQLLNQTRIAWSRIHNLRLLKHRGCRRPYMAKLEKGGQLFLSQWKWKLSTLPETNSKSAWKWWFPIGISFSRGLFSGAMLIWRGGISPRWVSFKSR